MTAPDTSGARPAERICMRCIDRQRQIIALRLEIERRTREQSEAVSDQRETFVTLLALVGGSTIVIGVLWLLGRLAVAIGGAS